MDKIELDIEDRGVDARSMRLFRLMSPRVYSRYIAFPAVDFITGKRVPDATLRRKAENFFRYQAEAPDWLRDRNGHAVRVGDRTPDGGIVKLIDHDQELWKEEFRKVVVHAKD